MDLVDFVMFVSLCSILLSGCFEPRVDVLLFGYVASLLSVSSLFIEQAQ